jgi:hypothetical protein
LDLPKNAIVHCLRDSTAVQATNLDQMVAQLALAKDKRMDNEVILIWITCCMCVRQESQHHRCRPYRGGFSLGLLVGLLYLAAGVVLWLDPRAGIVALTVFLAAVLVFLGLLTVDARLSAAPLFASARLYRRQRVCLGLQ